MWDLAAGACVATRKGHKMRASFTSAALATEYEIHIWIQHFQIAGPLSISSFLTAAPLGL